MKLGISSYCLSRKLESGEMSHTEVIRWAAQQGVQGIEIVSFLYPLVREDGSLDEALIQSVREAAREAGIACTNYSLLADFCLPAGEAFEAEVARVKRHVDAAAALGVPSLRSDLASFRRTREQNGTIAYDEQLPRIVEGARRIASYAQEKGLGLTVENHGFFVNGCDRIERLLHAVNHENYSLLLDTGNIACVDEDPSVAAGRLSKWATCVHLKDFYIRKKNPGDSTEFDCAGSWFRSMAGRYLRGAIFAQGDLDVYEILGQIKAAGFDGTISLEFEGMEDPLYATKVSLDNARRIWDEV